MKKTLILVRHAKSSWKNQELSDMERPLKKRGLKNAPLIGKVLNQMQVKPDLIVTSPAVRAVQTAKLIGEELGIHEELIVTNPKLYMESKDRLSVEISLLDDRYNTVMIVGHNPGLTDLTNALIADDIENVPTSGAVGIELNAESWKDIGNLSGRKLFFEYPKKHKKNKDKSEEKQKSKAEQEA